MAGLGLSNEEICLVVIDPATHKSISTKALLEHFEDELNVAAVRVKATIAKSLYDRATKGNAAAADLLEKRGRGQPTKFKREYLEQGAKLAAFGATNAEMASFFKVAESTLYKWRVDIPEFSEVLKNWREVADSRVEFALYNRAIGNDRIPADPTSMIFWLKNRQPDKWRDRREGEITLRKPIDPNADPIGDLAASIAALADKIAGDEGE